MNIYDHCRMLMTNGFSGFKICSFFSLPLSLRMFSRNTLITLCLGARQLLHIFFPDFLQKKVLIFILLLVLAFFFFFFHSPQIKFSVTIALSIICLPWLPYSLLVFPHSSVLVVIAAFPGVYIYLFCCTYRTFWLKSKKSAPFLHDLQHVLNHDFF